jgi:hypothetical protein
MVSSGENGSEMVRGELKGLSLKGNSLNSLNSLISVIYMQIAILSQSRKDPASPIVRTWLGPRSSFI